MGCVESKSAEDVEAKARNASIEADIRREKASLKSEVKMLLLGAGESGKSTVLKQFKLIHLNGYSVPERETFREIIFANTILSMRAILEAMPTLGLGVEPQNEVHTTTVLDPELRAVDSMSPECYSALKELCNDPGVKMAIRRSNEFQLNDSTVYYLQSLDRMAAPGYVPTDQDILRSRVSTTGITETVFKVGALTYKLFDVGGQRSERKKWIHCFENVTALVFLVGLSEYAQVLYEDNSVNRMKEALVLFESIVNSKWFHRTSIILFLNKIDLFREKLAINPLENYFPSYTGGDDYDAACDFFLKLFLAQNQSQASKTVFAHYTCATDTQQIKFVLSAVQNILLQLHLKETGLI
ncbi:heterotrimeric G protein alpha subunit B [Roridomyces roridus]|uniref:Heterotrimeric G protein alpha subunit B n=1 Tax=Roridomyces roridus TaxID=1738132 RepID=A0AAD7BDX7_9AGAR|nr:heterotrimeric G protein alpha subunit B [Roridomyces roridus]